MTDSVYVPPFPVRSELGEAAKSDRKRIREIVIAYLESNAERIIAEKFAERDALGNIYDKHKADMPDRDEIAAIARSVTHKILDDQSESLRQMVAEVAVRTTQDVVNSRIPSLVGEHGDTPHDEDCWRSFKEVVGKVLDESLANYQSYHGHPAKITNSTHNPGDSISVRILSPFPTPLGYLMETHKWHDAIDEWIADVERRYSREARREKRDWLLRRVKTLLLLAADRIEPAKEDF